MTSHELAKKLLEEPDMVVVCYDGRDPSDICEVAGIAKEMGSYFTEEALVIGEYIIIKP